MLTENKLSPLSEMSAPETGTVVEVRGPSPPGSRGGGGFETRLGYLGLVPGEKVRVIGNGNSDAVVVLIRESHVCMGRRIARWIVVRVDADEPNGVRGIPPAGCDLPALWK